MYRILAEDKNREASLAIDLLGIQQFQVEFLAKEIKRKNAQESVLILNLTAQPTYV